MATGTSSASASGTSSGSGSASTAALTRAQRFEHASHAKSVALGEGSVAPAERRGDWATERIRELAERQHGVVARRQLLELGLGRGLIASRVRSGHLIALYRGVFALGHRRIGRRGGWMAAVLACGPGAVLSHGSAARLWSVRGSGGPIEVARTSGHGGHPGIRIHQPRALGEDEVTRVDGIPVTTIERTLSDIAARLDRRRLERAVVAADRTGRLSWPALHRVVEASRSRKGARRLREVIRDVDPHAADARSMAEVDFLALCRDAGLPRPETNVLVEGRLVDFLWPSQRVVVETDGYAYHRDRPAFERDRESTVALELAGYRIHRITYRMLTDNPGPALALVRQSLANRRALARGQSFPNRNAFDIE